MSEEVKEVSDQPTQESSAPVEEAKEDKVAYDTYKRVLGEKKKTSETLTAERRKREELESRLLEAEGKKDELVDALKKQLESERETRTKEREDFAWQVLGSQIRSAAQAVGCADPDLLLKVGDFKSVSVNDDFTVDNDQLRIAIEDTIKKHPVLSKKPTPSVKDAPPNTNVNLDGRRDHSKMSLEELKDQYRDVAVRTGGKLL